MRRRFHIRPGDSIRNCGGSDTISKFRTRRGAHAARVQILAARQNLVPQSAFSPFAVHLDGNPIGSSPLNFPPYPRVCIHPAINRQFMIPTPFSAALLALVALAHCAYAAPAASAPAAQATSFAPSAPETVDYLRDIKPILSARCFSCHSALRQKANLRLDAAQLIRQGGESGPAFKPGQSAESLLLHAVTGTRQATPMPPKSEGEPLTEKQIALLAAWIDQGAVAPIGSYS